ncbi:MAG: PAS domain S-box protein [Spirochaetes bacterium]|nr:PAS domain S-box protein [Spirochaetota bacterium]
MSCLLSPYSLKSLINLRLRDQVNNKLIVLESFEKWKNSLVRLTSDLFAAGHVPEFSGQEFIPPPGSPEKESSLLIKSCKVLISSIKNKEDITESAEKKYRNLTDKINNLYNKLDKKISTVLALAQMDTVLGNNVSDINSLAPYVMKSLNELTLVAMNSLVSRRFTDTQRSLLTRNRRFLLSQLHIIDKDGSIRYLFDELFDQINILEKTVKISNQSLSLAEVRINETKEDFSRTVAITNMEEIILNAQLEVRKANRFLENASRRTLIAVFIFLFVVPVIIIITGIYGLNSAVIKPINLLINAMKNVVNGVYDFQTPLMSDNEIGKLGQAFNMMTGEIKHKVTEMSELNQTLSESEYRYRTLVDNLPQRIFLKNKDLVFVSCNPNFAGDLGIDIRDIAGKTDYDFHPAELAEKYREDDRRIILSGKPEEIEEKYFYEGREITVQTVKTPVRNKSGEVSGILGIFWDISERKRIEQAIKESRERLNVIFNSVQAGIVIIDKEHRIIIDANRAAVEMLETSIEDFTGHECYKILCPAGKTECPADLKEYSSDPFEKIIMTKQGRKLAVMKTIYPVILDGYECLLESFIDISRLKETENEKKQLEEQLRQVQKLESLGRLAGGVAHDLNNLLSPIMGYSEMLLDDSSVTGFHRESLNQVFEAGKRARDIVAQLLTFGRRQALEYKFLQINDVIENFRTLLRRTIRENIDIRISLDPGLYPVMGDAGQIEQVVMNLAVNAADAMPEGGMILIETAMTELDTHYALIHPDVESGIYVLLSVSDTGHGMNKETREKIFEPFFSTKGEMGTGLGLATVYGIVKQHGGNIWVYSEPGKGTIFKIYFPVAEQPLKDDKQLLKKSTRMEGTETILLVEDNDQVRNLTNIILNNIGFNVLVAENGSEALKIADLHNGPLHLLLTDVIMPGLNGKELFLILLQKYPDLRVLYMSGYTNDIIAHHGIVEEGMHFIQKPFTSESLIMKLREVIDS